MKVLVVSIIFFCISGELKSTPNSIHYDRQLIEISETVLPDSTKDKHLKWILLPIVFKSPDTGLAFGVLPQVVFRTGSSGNPSSIRMDSYYTQNRQYHLLLRSTWWFKQDTRNLSAKFSLKEWPTSFYGIGNNTRPDDKEKFTETLYDASINFTQQIARNLYAGAGTVFRYGKIRPDDPNGVLALNRVTGSGNTLISGLSTILRYDTRDNHFFPTSGRYHKAEVFASVKPLGSDYGFVSLTVDLRRYFSIHPSHVLAFRSVGIATNGSVPFRMRPSAGSLLRGYSSVRYIDNHLLSFQMEYRVVPLVWRLGFVAFAGIGEVFNRPDEIRLDHLKYNVGIGIRYVFSRSEKINIRFDYGMGRDSSGDYLDLNEAF
jgi:outer membrane protein assembly factor BamA